MRYPKRSPGAAVYKAVEVQDVEAEARRFTVVASDETVDRYGDVVRVSGWQLDAFKKNPIALWGHDHHSPIGTVPKVWLEGKKLMATMELAPEGTDEFIDKLWRLVNAKILRAVSVGFMPTVQPNYIRDEQNDHVTGFEFIGQELMELSLVSVPANPQALAVARAFMGEADAEQRIFNVASRDFNLEHRRRIAKCLEYDLKLLGVRHLRA